jgi:hypothetical protein
MRLPSFGRGRDSFNHVGNRRFQGNLVGMFIEKLLVVDNKVAKSANVPKILEVIREA